MGYRETFELNKVGGSLIICLPDRVFRNFKASKFAMDNFESYKIRRSTGLWSLKLSNVWSRHKKTTLLLRERE